MCGRTRVRIHMSLQIGENPEKTDLDPRALISNQTLQTMDSSCGKETALDRRFDKASFAISGPRELVDLYPSHSE